jgi:hypothetical protein
MRFAPLPVLLCCLVLVAACGPRVSSDPAAMTMRVHSVPPDRAEAMMGSLNRALRLGSESSVGTVSLGAPGELIVLAPESLQPSIEQSVQKLNAAHPDSGTRAVPQLRLRFWSVDASPGPGEDSPGLAPIAPALDALRKVQGDAHFVLRDEVESVSADGRPVRRDWSAAPTAQDARPATQKLQYSIMADRGQRWLELSFHDANHPRQAGATPGNAPRAATSISTSTTVTLGQTLVLATQPALAATPGGAASTRYYIVRVDDVGAD